LGIETLGGVMTALISKNTTIPTKKSEMFTTAADSQTSVEIHVLQGERPMASDNRTLGKFHLIGIPSAPRGIPQVEVTFDVDANGILNVSARDKATGKEQKITITSSSGLTKEEIDKMVKDAESHVEEDKQRREVMELKNQLDNLVYNTQKILTENRSSLSESDVKNLEASIEEARKALESNDKSEFKRAFDNLSKASHSMAESMYKKSAQQPPQPGEGEQKKPADGGDVIDAEFEDKK